MALVRVEVIGQQNVADALSHILLVFFLGSPRFSWNRAQHVVEQLAEPLVEAQPHNARDGGLDVHLQHVFPVGQVLARDYANAPHLLQPGFELTFFNTFRIESSEIVST